MTTASPSGTYPAFEAELDKLRCGCGCGWVVPEETRAALLRLYDAAMQQRNRAEAIVGALLNSATSTKTIAEHQAAGETKRVASSVKSPPPTATIPSLPTLDLESI